MKLFLFKLAFMHLVSGQLSNLPVPGYLIQTDDGQNILIDTGFPADAAENPQYAPPGIIIEMGEADLIVNRLKSIGLRPADINYLICTHFDPDHAGNHELFTNAELIVQRRHYEFALQEGNERFSCVAKHWNHPKLNYRLIDGDMEVIPGVVLIETSGHVPGHQAVLIRLAGTGTIILAIDAIPHSSMLDPERRRIMPLDMDERATRDSTRRLVELANQENAVLIIHGHDAQQWPTLKHAPQFYD